MGKVWDPATTVAYNNATTTLSTIVAIDESPLKDGLIYVGTDDGNLQTTEDGGKTWRKTTQFANVPDGYYITHVIASPIDSNVVFMSINNWQRGDFTPYIVRSDDRGKTFKSIAGDLPVGQDVWSVLQDWVDPDLLFAGTEFGLFFTVDGGAHWTQLKGMPVAQVRELKFQKRENDLVLATFGRGFYVLDDFSAFREMTADALQQEAQLYPLRTTYSTEEKTNSRLVWGNTASPNPPYGAILTYSVGSSASGNLVLTIANDAGVQVDRLDVPDGAGVHRVAWSLREGTGRPRRAAPAVARAARWRGWWRRPRRTRRRGQRGAARTLHGHARQAQRRHGDGRRQAAVVPGRAAAERQLALMMGSGLAGKARPDPEFRSSQNLY